MRSTVCARGVRSDHPLGCVRGEPVGSWRGCGCAPRTQRDASRSVPARGARALRTHGHRAPAAAGTRSTIACDAYVTLTPGARDECARAQERRYAKYISLCVLRDCGMVRIPLPTRDTQPITALALQPRPPARTSCPRPPPRKSYESHATTSRVSCAAHQTVATEHLHLICGVFAHDAQGSPLAL